MSATQRRRLTLAGIAIAVVAALVALAAGPGYRMELWPLGMGFSLLRWAAVGGLAGAVVAVTGGFLVRGHSVPLLAAALVAAVLGMATFALPYTWMTTAQGVPAIHDITTDTADPPRFVAVLAHRRDARNPPEYEGERVAALQRAAYPDIAPLGARIPPEAAFAAALAAADRMGWEIVAAVPEDGRIEASDTTFWFGFTDDVVVRITPEDGSSRIDVRSKSRIGRNDAGTNAKRVRAYLAALREATTAAR